MDKSSKRKSLYRRLFIEVTLSVLLLNVILAIITIQDTINIQINSDNDLRVKIRNEIIGISDFQTSALKTFEKSFYDNQKIALEALTINPNIDLRTENLNKQMKSLGLDSIFHDLYIIENNSPTRVTTTDDN